MKKAVLFIVMLFAITSFVSCTDLNDDDEFRTEEKKQVDPDTVKPPTGG